MTGVISRILAAWEVLISIRMRQGTRYTYLNTWGSGVPTSSVALNSQLNVGNWFTISEAGYIVGMRYFRDLSDNGEHYGQIRLEADNSPKGICTFHPKAAAGSGADSWQHAYFRPRIQITIGTRYYACVLFGRRKYYFTPTVLTTGAITVGPITVGQDTSAHWNGAFGNGIAVFNTHDAGTRYGVDILFLPASLL